MQFLADHPDCVAFMPHVNWPQSNDPYYLHNIADNNGRRAFYGVNAVPQEWVDGVAEPVYFYTYNNILAAYNIRKAVPTDVSLSYDGIYYPGTGQVDFTVTASTTSALPAGDYRLHIVLTEGDLFYNGPNTVDIHEHTLRKMFPTYNGTTVTFEGGFPQEAQATASFTLDPTYVPANCEFVYFLQDRISHEVYQAGAVSLEALMDLTDVAAAPARTLLGANYPNPFNPSTAIPLTLDEQSTVRLTIHDVDGRLVRTLHEGLLPAGHPEFRWDGTDTAGQPVASGVYLARLSSDDAVQSRRLVLMK